MSEREAWQVTDDAAVLYERSFVPALFARAALALADAAEIGPGQRVLDVERYRGGRGGAAGRAGSRRRTRHQSPYWRWRGVSRLRSNGARATPVICRSTTAPSTWS